MSTWMGVLPALWALGWILQAPAVETAPRPEPPEALLLDGVIFAQNPADSVALLRRSDAARGRAVKLGEEHGGYVLIEVARDSVLLQGRDGTIRLFLSGERVLERPPSMAAGEDPRWIRREFSREPSRRRLDKEIGVILSDTRLEPNVEEGRARGLRLDRLPDGTLLSESGLLPGDLLLSLNEEPLTDLDALWETLAHLDGEDELRLVVERRGRVLRLAYDLVE